MTIDAKLRLLKQVILNLGITHGGEDNGDCAIVSLALGRKPYTDADCTCAQKPLLDLLATIKDE